MCWKVEKLNKLVYQTDYQYQQILLVIEISDHCITNDYQDCEYTIRTMEHSVCLLHVLHFTTSNYSGNSCRLFTYLAICCTIPTTFNRAVVSCKSSSLSCLCSDCQVSARPPNPHHHKCKTTKKTILKWCEPINNLQVTSRYRGSRTGPADPATPRPMFVV